MRQRGVYQIEEWILLAISRNIKKTVSLSSKEYRQSTKFWTLNQGYCITLTVWLTILSVSRISLDFHTVTSDCLTDCIISFQSFCGFLYCSTLIVWQTVISEFRFPLNFDGIYRPSDWSKGSCEELYVFVLYFWVLKFLSTWLMEILVSILSPVFL